jgi:phospholipid/cholesterol/gamma-HCH transport system permease protein
VSPTFRVQGPEAGRLSLFGPLTAQAPGRIWKALLARRDLRGTLTLDLGGLSALDLNGAAQLLWLRETLGGRGLAVSFEGLAEAYAPIWRLAENSLGPPTPPPPQPDAISRLGRLATEFLADVAALIAFLGELLPRLAGLALRPWRGRWTLTLRLAQTAAVDALPVTALVAFLVGLILAFQSAMFMKLFGVDIFVADLVGLSVVRELGTLLTAIVLTGRSGSAFSAELATMKTNQEIDAFLTMGLSPTRDLALPRVLALTAATPLLTVLADFAGLLGGDVVMIALGHPAAAFWTELSQHLDASDVSTGLFKAIVFGFTVAAVGCQRGLAAGSGPEAVGQAATRGVVSNIVILAALDSLFAVVFYVLDW